MEKLPLPDPRIRAAFSSITVLFCFGIIALLTLTGDPINSLHQSALAWSFSLSGFVIAGYIFGAVVDTWAIWRSPAGSAGTVSIQKK